MNQLARRISPASLEVSREAMRQEAVRVSALASVGQQVTLAEVFAGCPVGRHPAVEVHTYEASRDGPDVLAHRTFKFQDTGNPLFDYRTQLFRIDPIGVARCI